MPEATLVERNRILSEALTKAAAQFRHYEQQHRDKKNKSKAETNHVMAEMCEAALAQGAPRR